MQTSPVLGVTKCPIQIPCSPKIRIPHRVHRAWTHGAHEANTAGKLNTIHSSGWGLETRCSSGRGEFIKKGREVNGPHHEMTI